MIEPPKAQPSERHWLVGDDPSPCHGRRYSAAIGELERAITLHRRSEQTGADITSSNLAPAACSCPRRVRVAPGTLARGPIVCGICGVAFEFVARG